MKGGRLAEAQDELDLEKLNLEGASPSDHEEGTLRLASPYPAGRPLGLSLSLFLRESPALALLLRRETTLPLDHLADEGLVVVVVIVVVVGRRVERSSRRGGREGFVNANQLAGVLDVGREVDMNRRPHDTGVDKVGSLGVGVGGRELLLDLLGLVRVDMVEEGGDLEAFAGEVEVCRLVVEEREVAGVLEPLELEEELTQI